MNNQLKVGAKVRVLLTKKNIKYQLVTTILLIDGATVDRIDPSASVSVFVAWDKGWGKPKGWWIYSNPNVFYLPPNSGKILEILDDLPKINKVSTSSGDAFLDNLKKDAKRYSKDVEGETNGPSGLKWL